jgi:hypothetical protein
MARLLLFIVLFISGSGASAFDGWEHKQLSDLAYHLAIEIHCPDTTAAVICSELRPETTVDVSKHGRLATWCSTRPLDTVCRSLATLYLTPPRAEFASSNLRKACTKNPDDEPACKQIEKILASSEADDPVNYRDHRALLWWCHSKADKDLCKAVTDNLANGTAYRKRLVLDCFGLPNPTEQCEFNFPSPIDRLSSASFFDPLSREFATSDKKENNKHENDSDLSYGDVTKCVDDFLTPDKLMAGSETALWRETEDQQLKNRARLREGELYPKIREHLDLSFKNRCKESYWNLEGARSAHVNHTHFQAEVLIAQRSQHLLALTLHSIEGNRLAALTANAISDHYLHDSLAPGHITTWRSRLTDLAANAFHDAINRKGLLVAIDKNRAKAIVDKDGKPLYARFVDLAARDTRTSDAATVREYFLYPVEDKQGDCTGCRKRKAGEEAPNIQRIVDKLVEKIPVADKPELDRQCMDTPDTCVMVRGDGQLWNPVQDEQRLLLLLIQVRSILDVFESAPKLADGTNQYTIKDSFKENSWNWHATGEEPESLAGTMLFPPPSQLVAGIGPVKYDIRQSYENDTTKYNHRYQEADLVFGVSAGVDNMMFGDQQNRYHLSAERLMFGLASPRQHSFNVGAVLGAQAYSEPASSGYGVIVRLSLVFPQTETIFSIPMRAIRIGTIDSNRRWKPTIGLRMDQGFTSFFTTYFQVTRDHAAQRDGRIDSGVSIGAGIQLAAPRCRIPLIKKTCD